MSISAARQTRLPLQRRLVLAVRGTAVLNAILFLAASLHAQEYDWAKRVCGSTAEDMGYSVAVDNAGNVLTTGFFSGTADFDPGLGALNLTSAGNYDAFVSKLDPDGNLVWARRIGSYDADEGFAIATLNGAVYVTGEFQGSVDFDPDPNVQFPLSCGWGWETFLLKLDGDGNFVWAKCLGSYGGMAQPSALVLDASGNIYLGGRFQHTTDFDFDPDTEYSLTPPSGTPAMFIAKYDSNAGFVWARQMGGVFSEDLVGIAVDSGGNVYSTGEFYHTVDFDPGPGVFNLTSPRESNVFIQKLDSTGNFVWAKQLGGLDISYAAAIAVDGDGSVLTTGQFSGVADFDPSPNSTLNLTSSSSSDMFVSRLDTSGNFVWALRVGGPGVPLASTIAIDGAHHIYASGRFGGTLDFDPGPGTANIASRSWDIFLSKLDANGDFVWATGLGGASEDGAFGFVLDNRGKIYASGYYSSTADFVPGPGISNLTSAGDYDVFAVKLEQTPSVTFSDRTNLSWRSVFGETAYNVYRSDTGLPGSFSCLASHVTSPSTNDAEIPATGGLFAYLVTTITAAGEEGSMGFQAVNGTPISERPNVSPCR